MELIEKPVAEIASNPMHTGINSNGDKYIEVCDGQEIQFFSDATSSADAPIVGYYWEDGATSYSTEDFTFTANHDVHGDYTKINLTVTNECGCEDRVTYIVHISKFPSLKVDCYGTACEGDEVTYTAIDQSCAEFFWTIEGGDIMAGQMSPSITVQWNDIQDGYGYLALDGEHCNQEMCPSLTYLPIPVIEDEVIIDGPTVVCRGEIFSFKLPLWASTSYNWSFHRLLLPCKALVILMNY